MAVFVTRNFGRLATEVRFSDRTLMREIGLLARERIIRRTLSGQSEQGRAFRPYSPRYRQQKSRELGSGGTVTLQLSGAMLQAIVITDISDTMVELGFKS